MSMSATGTLLLGAGVGLVAALVMDWPMARQPDGFVPAYIATAVVTRQPIDSVRLPEAMVLHHLAGVLAGLLYGLIAVGLGGLFPSLVSLDGLNIVAHLLAVGGVVGFIYSFFAHVVLPRAGGRTYEERATAVRGQWLRSALVFGTTLLVGVPAALTSLSL